MKRVPWADAISRPLQYDGGTTWMVIVTVMMVMTMVMMMVMMMVTRCGAEEQWQVATESLRRRLVRLPQVISMMMRMKMKMIRAVD